MGKEEFYSLIFCSKFIHSSGSPNPLSPYSPLLMFPLLMLSLLMLPLLMLPPIMLPPIFEPIAGGS
jgi:hypothetical protein